MTPRSSAITQAHWASGGNILAGVWLLLAPLALDYSDVPEALWNDVIIGATVAILALVRVGNPLQYEGISWTNFVLGGWLVIAPFALGYGDVGDAVADDITVGIIVLALAAWSALASRNEFLRSDVGTERERDHVGASR
jgi:hypothetical protein